MDFDVVKEPAPPGPYLSMGCQAVALGQAIDGAVIGNGARTVYHVPAEPDAEFRVVGLVPEDECPPTYAVLRRRTR